MTDIGPEMEMVPPRLHMSFAGTFIEITVSDNLATVIRMSFSYRNLLGRLSTQQFTQSVCQMIS
jgi:hypothetical protein